MQRLYEYMTWPELKTSEATNLDCLHAIKFNIKMMTKALRFLSYSTNDEERTPGCLPVLSH